MVRIVIRLERELLSRTEADAFFARVRDETPWKHEPIKIFGKEILQPRLTAWFGDPGATYRYSGIVNEPIPWTDALLELKARVEAIAGGRFNSALLNYYRDGRDSVGLHSDDEPELGKNPLIASVSLGVPRKFVMIPKAKRDRAKKIELILPHGSLLLMGGETQHLYKHGVPKQLSITEPRINLTFRRVLG
jgi:alkylated DNA repair dioxygenase AlkB